MDMLTNISSICILYLSESLLSTFRKGKPMATKTSAHPAKYGKNRHSCYILKYHLVVVTKYRRPVLTEDVSYRLVQLTKALFEDSWGCNVISAKTDPKTKDHIHILFEAPPQVQLSKLVNNFKNVTSRLLRKEFPDIVRKYYWKPVFWSRSYFIGCVSDVTEEIVSHYIANQGKD